MIVVVVVDDVVGAVKRLMNAENYFENYAKPNVMRTALVGELCVLH